MPQGREINAIRITNWLRYEVNSKGEPAKRGDELRVSELRYLRVKNYGHQPNRGLGKLQKIAKKRTMEVLGIFTRLLQIAGNGTKGFRGVIREEHDGRPATPQELTEILPATRAQVDFALKCLAHPTVSWITVDKQGFPETSENSGDLPEPYISKAKLSKDNTSKDNSTQGIPEDRIFSHWNLYKGQGDWKSHNELSYEIRLAITEQLKHYSVITLCAAIDNYAKVLLGKDFKWSYPWNLRELMSRTKKDDRSEQQLWRFLPNNFHEKDYIKPAALKRRIKDRREWEYKIRDAEQDKLVESYKTNFGELNWLIEELRPEIRKLAQE